MSDIPAATPQVGDPATPPVGTPSVTPPAVPPADAAETFPKEYVQTLRGEAADTRKKLRDAEAKLQALELEKLTAEERKDRELELAKQEAETARREAQAFQAQIAERERQLLCSKVAAEVFQDAKTAEGFASRLRGETEAELKKDAEELRKLFPTFAPPDDLGRRNNGNGTQISDAERASAQQSYANQV